VPFTERVNTNALKGMEASKMIQSVGELEAPGFTLPDLEEALGYSWKSLYPAVKRGDLPIYEGPRGEMRVKFADAAVYAGKRLERLGK
jgi:hypothetical protein